MNLSHAVLVVARGLGRLAGGTLAFARRVVRAIVRAAKSRLRPLLERRVYRMRRGLAPGLRRRGGFGFVPQLGSTPEQRFLRGQHLEGLTVYDVGTFEGIHSLFFSGAVGETGHVVGFEPNPHTHCRALENLELNHITNVEVLPIAVGDRSEVATLRFDPRDAGRGSIDSPGQPERGADRQHSVSVDVRPLDELVTSGRIPPPDFVKIDVEGAESAVLAGMDEIMRRFAPSLFIEVHGRNEAEKRATVRSIISRQAALGYRCRHVETDRELDVNDPELPIRGHLYCTHARPS
jgi:FkbM family methyltransferase